ncbi:MAG: metallophosphoesterase family protein [Actinomycetota bacterium]
MMRIAALCAGLMLALAGVQPQTTAASYSSSLRRYPYLTDLVSTNVTINWATTTSASTGSVRYGRSGVESCTAHTVTATQTSITVGSTTEYQWKAQLSGLSTDSAYCYRVYGGTTDLLGSDASPIFRSQVSSGSNASYSFAVFGDWGVVDGGGNNADQARLMSQIAASGARFAVTSGDTAYDSGSQKNYGDLVQKGTATSSIFGPSFWTVAGDSIAMFNTQGNHGLNSVPLVNWPQDRAVAGSNGRYQMDTYCCSNGTSSRSYPSEWYAFDAGRARFYVLDAAWSNSNVGDTDLYENDYDAHWTSSRAEYQWLANDLASNPRTVSFAFLHFPLYADNANEGSDPWLAGSSHLEGLLAKYGVDIVFNGHAHIYERNRASATGMPVSYVTGGGGGKLAPVNRCSSIDQYAIGWSYSASTHGSACGTAPRPSTIDRVFHFLLVTVNGTQVTVTPTDELGRTFDVQSYSFG